MLGSGLAIYLYIDSLHFLERQLLAGAVVQFGYSGRCVMIRFPQQGAHWSMLRPSLGKQRRAGCGSAATCQSVLGLYRQGHRRAELLAGEHLLAYYLGPETSLRLAYAS